MGGCTCIPENGADNALEAIALLHEVGLVRRYLAKLFQLLWLHDVLSHGPNFSQGFNSRGGGHLSVVALLSLQGAIEFDEVILANRHEGKNSTADQRQCFAFLPKKVSVGQDKGGVLDDVRWDRKGIARELGGIPV